MSEAETLREAARLMRERAGDTVSAVGDEPWHFLNLGWNDVHGTTYTVENKAGSHVAEAVVEEVAEHIASWHPAVALAVADWLDFEAVRSDAAAGMLTCTADVEVGPPPAIVNGATNAPSSLTYSNLKTGYGYCCPRALAVARAYLGGDA